MMGQEIKLLSPGNLSQGFKVDDPEDVLEELDEMMRTREGGAFLGLERDPENYNKESYGGVLTIVPVEGAGDQTWVVDMPDIDAYAEVTRAALEDVVKRWFSGEPLGIQFQKYALMLSRPENLKPGWARF